MIHLNTTFHRVVATAGADYDIRGSIQGHRTGDQNSRKTRREEGRGLPVRNDGDHLAVLSTRAAYCFDEPALEHSLRYGFTGAETLVDALSGMRKDLLLSEAEEWAGNRGVRVSSPERGGKAKARWRLQPEGSRRGCTSVSDSATADALSRTRADYRGRIWSIGPRGRSGPTEQFGPRVRSAPGAFPDPTERFAPTGQ